MTALSVAVVLCLIHASFVVVATTLARFCVGRRFASSRAVVGTVGMSCILLVTVLTFLPRPSLWPSFDATTINSSEESDRTHPNVNGAAEILASAGQQSITTVKSADGIPISSVWLRRLGDSLRNATVAASAAPPAWKYVLIVILLGGIGMSIIRLLLALRSLQRLYWTSTAIQDERVAAIVTDSTRRCRCRRPIELRETDELASAATFGFLKPVILLPVQWRCWSHDELAAVLAHEVAHIRRGDYLQRLIAQLGTAIHFYHPLVRASARCLAADQEFAADRLASGLRSNQEAYVRGLAKLALRLDDSFHGDRSWSNVSIMPKSSDFLARRLEMLRTKKDLSSKRSGRIMSACASISVVLVALASTLLRGTPSAAEGAAANSAAPPHAATKGAADKEVSGGRPVETLFGRSPFDVSVIPHAEDGAFVIRIGDLLRQPEVQPHVDELSRAFTDSLRGLIGKKDLSIDLRQIEWIAGVIQMKVKMMPGKETQSAFVLGADPIVIRMAHAGNWQEVIRKSVPGGTLETFEGQNYVQSAMIPAMGPGCSCKFRFPDDKTIIFSGLSTRSIAANSNQSFFDTKSSQQTHAWTEAWRAVDGGLVTFVFDNSKIGWSVLPDEKQDWPQFTAPLYEKTKYIAVGLDCTETTKLAGIRVRGTCADHDAVKELHLASSILLNRWPELCQDNDEAFVKNHTRILQLLSSVKIQPSRADGDQHFLQASAEMTLKEREVLEILRSIFGFY